MTDIFKNVYTIRWGKKLIENIGICKKILKSRINDVSIDNQSGNYIIDAVLNLSVLTLRSGDYIEGTIDNCSEEGILIATTDFMIWVDKTYLYPNSV